MAKVKLQFRSGVSLIEILLVIIVIAIIFLMGYGQYLRYIQKRNVAIAKDTSQQLLQLAKTNYLAQCATLLPPLSKSFIAKSILCSPNNTGSNCPPASSYGNMINPFYNPPSVQKGSAWPKFLFTMTGYFGVMPVINVILPVGTGITTQQAIKYAAMTGATWAPYPSDPLCVYEYKYTFGGGGVSGKYPFSSTGLLGCLVWSGTSSSTAFNTTATSAKDTQQLHAQLTTFTAIEQPAFSIQNTQQPCQVYEERNIEKGLAATAH